MMKTILIAMLAIVVIGGCSNQNKSVNGTGQYDGTWAENEEQNALFIIKGDTMTNVDHGDKMYFTVLHDTMTIDYVASKAKYFIIKASDDSLILANPDKSVTRLYKRSK